MHVLYSRLGLLQRMAIRGLGAILSLAVLGVGAASAAPNIVIMLADDMGFGEVQCLNPERGKIATPHLDALARQGLVFTDAHSGSSVCTPTRYGLMTGRYAWRTRLQQGVLTGGSSLLAADRLTLAKILKARGYQTAILGKWHLGMLYDGKEVRGRQVALDARVTHGPIDRGGFDLFRGFHHSRQMTLWIQDDRVSEHLQPVEMLPRLTQTAVDFIRHRTPQDPPFFLYIPWNSPHSPVVPSPAWQGRSGLNAHADFVMQTDDAFGQVIQALKDTGNFDNTLIIGTSDNGTSAPTSKLAFLQSRGHFPSANLRGSKSDIWDGGHRVPFLVSWPARIDRPRRVDELVCLSDVFATVAELTDYDLPPDAAEDSLSFAPLLMNPASAGSRTSVIHHSVQGHFAIRKGHWKLICCPGSGGWSKPTTKKATAAVADGEPPVQLYDISQDIGETTNLAMQNPEIVRELRSLLEAQIQRGRSTPGVAQTNDVPVVIDKWKSFLPK